jgi:hypothetical protein
MKAESFVYLIIQSTTYTPAIIKEMPSIEVCQVVAKELGKYPQVKCIEVKNEPRK